MEPLSIQKPLKSAKRKTQQEIEQREKQQRHKATKYPLSCPCYATRLLYA